ncbi:MULTISPECIES: arsinothricin resistance N-acetyltransferase ArsN1 family B [Pseudomonas]|uniref:GNAT family N-acetyltransferase n=5 Tax=Pseudomonas TaxID=286 RepID=A0A1C2D9C9_9PSED|nr:MULTISPECIES: arsinothricin resistance N-acetyltransferase ArsN1 family B [Pseudomonas]RMU70500.1 Phosphinothricin N-acetyltransferase [Pseudomonas syringae pv. aptata]AKF47408.1 Sortase-related acyltransferase [Pseudomonas syringae pv. syringae B301D]AKF48554.1 Sortase-related acyltransferase [Pseudomonas syringae pv. syringae B301D]EXL30079.1 Phosphinothricin N-acetyltransferase [Pseudomonas syringae pv. syringae str. B301D-R]MCF5197061.1 GNAT family N-acetyltransferase [Pseudomonas syrin
MSKTTVRIAQVSDAQAIQAIYAPMVESTTISFELEPPSVEEMAMRIESTLLTYPYLVAVRDGQVIGYAYASQHRAREAYRWSVDVTVYISPEAHRSGVGRALYDVLLPTLKKQGFHAAYAGIALPNDGSVGLHEALGFAHIGTYPEVGFKHGAWRDVGYWRIALDSTNPPKLPVLFSEISLF